MLLNLTFPFGFCDELSTSLANGVSCRKDWVREHLWGWVRGVCEGFPSTEPGLG